MIVSNSHRSFGIAYMKASSQPHSPKTSKPGQSAEHLDQLGMTVQCAHLSDLASAICKR